MKRLIFIFGIIGMLLAFNSCEEDDGYSLGDFWVSLAVVEQADPGSETFSLHLDNGQHLWPAANNAPSFKTYDGQRVLVNYTILNDLPEDDVFDHYVVINGLSEILTKDTIAITPENTDSLGNDAIHVKDMWIAQDFLNISFSYFGGQAVHFLNLGLNEEDQPGDEDQIVLEFRHNRNDDPAAVMMSGLVSFRLDSFKKEGEDGVSLKILVNDFDEEKEFTFFYSFIE